MNLGLAVLKEQDVISQICQNRNIPTGKGLYIQGHLGLPTTRPQLTFTALASYRLGR